MLTVNIFVESYIKIQCKIFKNELLLIRTHWVDFLSFD